MTPIFSHPFRVRHWCNRIEIPAEPFPGRCSIPASDRVGCTRDPVSVIFANDYWRRRVERHAVATREIDATAQARAIRPPLKWAGGKRWQLPHLAPLWDQHCGRRLVEPFCGGLAVTTGLLPQRALLNDINPHVVNFYEWLKRGLAISLDMRNEAVAYYVARKRFNALLEAGQPRASEAAALFYYLNRTGYNGLCRFNARGRFNVPFGKYRTINYRT